MAVTPFVPLAMFGWIPVVIVLFARLRPHRAAVAGFLLAWMFLPQYAYALPGLPDYNKISAASFGILAGALLYDRTAALASYRLHAADAPILAWCLAAPISSLSNGLGLYDGLSMLLTRITTWGIPYFIGRVFLNRADHLADLCRGIFFGALVYVPFCLYEIVMSPRLHKLVYGFHSHNFGQTKRGGGWRPVIFMKHGLMNAMWMVSGTVAGLCLLFSRNLPRRLPLLPVATGALVALVFVVTLLCKSFGAFSLMVIGLAVIAAATRLRARWPLGLLVIIPLLYMGLRASGAWDGQNLIRASLAISNAERAGSLEFRINNENMLIEKALERPLFGWAGWKRSYVRNDAGVTISVPDGLWIIVFGQNGLFGLVAVSAVLILPPLLLLHLFSPARWREPEVAALVPLAVLLVLFMIDNLFNDMFNPVMLLSAGGLTGLWIRRQAGAELEQGLAPSERANADATANADAGEGGTRLL
jgi:hypothetical protein